MSTKVILTADDYGVVPEINEGIIDLVNLGAINSVEVFPNFGPGGSKSVENTLHLLNETKNSGHPLELGVHLTITSGSPIKYEAGLDPIVINQGKFVSYRHLQDTADPSALYRELERQLKVLLDHPEIGPKVTHLTNHHDSLWFYPNYAKVLVELADFYKLPIRNTNSIPKGKSWIYYVAQNLVRKLDKADKKEIKKFYNIRKKMRFPGMKVSFKSTDYMDSRFYYAGYLSGQIAKSEIEPGIKRKRRKLSVMFKRAESDSIVEFMFHVSKGDIYGWAGKDKVPYYSGINPKYFDGRALEYQGLKDRAQWIQNKFASPDFEPGSWKNTKKITFVKD